MSFICLPSCPQHCSLSPRHCSPFNGHFFIFTFLSLFLYFLFFFGLTRTHSCHLIVLLAFLSFHWPPLLSPTHPLSLFSKPQFPSHDFHFFSYDFFFFQPNIGLCILPLLTCVCPLLLHFSCFLGLIYCSTLPTGWLFLSYRVFLLLDSLCSYLFLPSVSDLLFVLVLSETEAQAVRGSYQPQ